MNISLAQLQATLQSVRGAKFMTIVVDSEPQMTKTRNPFYGNVVKRSKMNVTMNFNYQRSLEKVTGIRATPHARTWGERVPNSPFVVSKGFLYVEFKRNARAKNVQFFLKNEQREMTAEEQQLLQNFIPQKAPQPVPVMDVKITNIRELFLDRKHLIIT